ncbi:MAG: DUF2490 domain-containing protein [Myxococcota bacterium]
MRWLFVFLLSLVITTPHALAQEAPTMGVWTGQLMSIDLDAEKDAGLKVWLDLHERQMPGSFVAIVRPGIGYDTGKGVSVWAGYGWIPTWDGDTLRNEHRIWQQAIGKTTVKAVSLMGRLRLEQRFLDGASKVGHRVRVFARSGFKLTESYGLSLWDETFIHLNDTSFSTPGLNQNRAFFGPYIKAEKGWRTEFGYLNLVVNQGDSLAMSHVLAMNIFIPFTVGK